MKLTGVIGLAALLMAGTAGAQPAPAAGALRPDQVRFRDLYKELVETNTQLSSGDCTVAAGKMAARLRAAGYPDNDLHLFTAPEHPKEGGLVAVLHGADPSAKAILLLAHIDVVEARREDWARDPFTLVEEGGFFYGRGTADDKAMAAVAVDTLIRFRQEGFKPKRDVKIALTCGEETATAFNGASWLATHERQLIDAEFALNEGAGGRLDADGKPIALNIQAGEKFPQDYKLDVVNPGGHSSRPVKNNAIYHLAAGLMKLSQYDFPVRASDTTRTYFQRMSRLVGGEMGAAMAAFAANPQDARAAATMETDPGYNGMIHTTCVATMLNAGHATNALPQHAQANVNCRIFPGESVEDVQAVLQKVVDDPEIRITAPRHRSGVAPPPPLNPQVTGPIEQVAAKMWPGVPVIPVLQAGATDAAFLTPVGIPTYGVTGIFFDADGNGAHGLNERLRVKSLYDGRDFLYAVTKIYSAN